MISLIFATAMLMTASPSTPALAMAAPAPAVERVADVRVETQTSPSLSSVAVTLECTAHASGHVDGCKVLGETHPGLGFGAAAVALMQDAEVAPGSRDVQFAKTIQFVP